MKIQYLICIFFISFIHTTCFASTTFFINGDGVNIRSGPGTTYKVTKIASRGSEVSQLKTEQDWKHIQFLKNGSEGWIHTSLLTPRSPATRGGWASTTTARPPSASRARCCARSGGARSTATGSAWSAAEPEQRFGHRRRSHSDPQ